jgi:hypothetical protein
LAIAESFILRRKKELSEERRSKFEKSGLNIIFAVNNTYAKDGALNAEKHDWIWQGRIPRCQPTSYR